jgi:hypothetical protein
MLFKEVSTPFISPTLVINGNITPLSSDILLYISFSPSYLNF